MNSMINTASIQQIPPPLIPPSCCFTVSPPEISLPFMCCVSAQITWPCGIPYRLPPHPQRFLDINKEDAGNSGQGSTVLCIFVIPYGTAVYWMSPAPPSAIHWVSNGSTNDVNSHRDILRRACNQKLLFLVYFNVNAGTLAQIFILTQGMRKMCAEDAITFPFYQNN